MSEFSTLDALSAAMEAAFTANHPRRGLHDEQVRRKVALQSIDENPSEWRPLFGIFGRRARISGAARQLLARARSDRPRPWTGSSPVIDGAVLASRGRPLPSISFGRPA